MSTRHVSISTLRLSGFWTSLKPQFPGRVFARCDTSGSDMFAYLPPAGDYTGSELVIFKAVAANDLFVTPSTKATINGTIVSVEINDIGQTFEVYSDGTTWRPMNPTTVIT